MNSNGRERITKRKKGKVNANMNEKILQSYVDHNDRRLNFSSDSQVVEGKRQEVSVTLHCDQISIRKEFLGYPHKESFQSA